MSPISIQNAKRTGMKVSGGIEERLPTINEAFRAEDRPQSSGLTIARLAIA